MSWNMPKEHLTPFEWQYIEAKRHYINAVSNWHRLHNRNAPAQAIFEAKVAVSYHSAAYDIAREDYEYERAQRKVAEQAHREERYATHHSDDAEGE